jgi:ribosomal protein S18 acetylase RimI-like enzyme
MAIEIVEVGDADSFVLIPPCADARFDHRTCDYWEDADRGSKASRAAWLEAAHPAPTRPAALVDNPFAPAPRQPAFNPFSSDEAENDFNPFAPTAARERPLREGVPRKLALLDRGRGVFGSYAKVLLVDGEAVAYCQFGPLSAYPRASTLRELYPQLPDSPLPAVITCIATTAEARRAGHAKRLVLAVCDDLAARGFSAVEAYPDTTLGENEASGARPGFWHVLGFATAVDDERYPVMRREL